MNMVWIIIGVVIALCLLPTFVRLLSRNASMGKVEGLIEIVKTMKPKEKENGKNTKER